MFVIVVIIVIIVLINIIVFLIIITTTRFAVEAVGALGERVLDANFYGSLVGADQNSELNVNEFESLEACRWCPYKIWNC